ncbi:MAG: sigma factor [Chloroflexota bacterium]
MEQDAAGLIASAPPDAFGAWVRPHLGVITRLAARLAPPGERDDVIQETLARAWSKWSLFDPARGTPSRLAARDHRGSGAACSPAPSTLAARGTRRPGASDRRPP